MAVHFEKTHFACKLPECKEKGFIVFKDKSELDYHNQKEHGMGTSRIVVKHKDPKANVPMKDKEGLDVSSQVRL